MKKYKAIIVFLTIIIKATAIQDPINTTESETNKFYKINQMLQNSTGKLFETLKINEEFYETYNTQLLIIMHGHLKKITENNYDIYMDIKNASRVALCSNKTVINMTEVLTEILYNDDELEFISKDEYWNENNANTTKELKSIELINNLLRMIDDLDLNTNGTSQSFVKTRRRKKHELKKWDPSSAIEVLLSNNTRRVYNGMSTEIERFPFMASIHVADIFTCAGSVISKYLIITAGSCLEVVNNERENSTDSLTARVGSVYTRREGKLLPIKEVHFHPSYDSQHLQNNIALARVPNVGEVPGVRRIVYEKTTHTLPKDTVVSMLGWGDKEDELSRDQSALAISQISLYNHRVCKGAYTENYVNEQNICTGFTSKGDGACSRDLGGPGLIHGILTGIVSFGPPVCGTPDAPTVFTRVGYYADWIESIAEGDNEKNPEAPNKQPRSAYIDSEAQKIQKSMKPELNQVPLTIDFLKSILGKIVVAAGTGLLDKVPRIGMNSITEISRILKAFKQTNNNVDNTTKKTKKVTDYSFLNIQRTGAITANDEFLVTSNVYWDDTSAPLSDGFTEATSVKSIRMKETPSKLSTIKDAKFLREIQNVKSILEPTYLNKLKQKLIAADEDYQNKEDKEMVDPKNSQLRKDSKELSAGNKSKQNGQYINFETDHYMSILSKEEPFSGQLSLDIDYDHEHEHHKHRDNKFDETNLRLGVNINT